MTPSRVAVVTGASGGIGSAVVAELIDHGYRVVGIVLDPPAEPHPDADYVLADVSVSAQIDPAIAGVVREHGRVDVLVTTAAILRSTRIHEMSEASWDEIVDINLKGVFLSCRAVLPSMIAAGAGSIVNLSSVHALASVPGAGAYAATKGAVLSLSKQLAVDYADDGIRVNALVVGSVDTAMTDLHRQLLERDGVALTPPSGRIGRMAQPEEIARAVRFLADEESSFVTGAALTIDGGLLSSLM